MGNCLVTKLKAVVDNDNLVKLNWIRIKNGVSTDGGVKADALFISIDGGYEGNAELHNATQQNDIISWSNKDAWVDVKKELLFSVYNYGLNRGSAKFNVEDLIGCTILDRVSVTGIMDTENSCYGNIDKIGVISSLTRFEVGDNPNISGNISSIPAISSRLTQVNIQNTGITGNVDCFINNGALVCPLTVLNIGNVFSGNSPLRISVSSIVICANNGCEFFAHENQIVWDTMTKEAFQAAYESYPTPPTIAWNM